MLNMLVRSEQWPSTFFASSLESFLRGLPPRVRKVSQVSYQFTCNMLSPTRRYEDLGKRFLCRPKRKKELECLITKLQAKQKVFGDEFSAAYALDLMNKFIRKVIREHLVGIYETDGDFGEFLCHVFFRRRTHIDDEDIHVPSKNKGEMWQNTKEPLYCLLVAAYVSNAMAHTFSDQEDFRQNHEYYESIAWSIFDEMYQNNEVKLEYHVLAFDYESIYKDNLSMNEKGELVIQWKRQKKIYEQWQKSSRELLCVAYRGQCMKFVSHVACQNYIKTRWKYGKVGRLFEVESIHTGKEKVENGKTNQTLPIKTKNRISSLLKHCKSWLTVVLWTPQSKYLIHMVFNLVFIVFFAMALLKKPWRQLVEPDQKDGAFNLWTFAFFYVLVSLILETAEQVLKIFYIMRKGWHKAYWWVNYGVRFLRFALFAANCISLNLAASIKIYSSFFFPVCEILFTASFVLSTITTLKYFSFSDYFGAKIQLIREMANSIFKYMAILVVFWIIYAVCYLSLTEGISVNQETTVWQLFQSGVFEILGESRDEDRDGTISECSNVRWQSVNFEKPDQVRCLFRSSLIPPLLFLYMMTATIMLINIFTAMLSHEYEVSNQNATNYSRFHKYEILARFESKIFFPRPLNIIYIVGWIFYKVGSWFKCEYYVRCSCCKDLSDVFPFNIVISWFSSVRSWGSSPKDAEVNEAEVRNLLKWVLAKRGTNDFVDAVQKLITDWKQTHRNPESPGQDRIEEAHKVLEGVIGKFKDFLSTETEGVRRRVDTALEEIRSTTPALTGDVLERVRNRSGATGRERAAINP